MTKKVTFGTIITAVLVIGVLGTLNFDTNTNHADDISIKTTQNDNAEPYMAYAAKPVQQIVPVDISSTEYGAGSTFENITVECKLSTTNGETTVNWCKATGIMNKVDFLTCFQGSEECQAVISIVLEEIFDEEPGIDFDKAIVEWEVEQLTDTINPILTAEYPGIVIPDYQSKSVELEMSLQNDETSQTKAEIGIEYI